MKVKILSLAKYEIEESYQFYQAESKELATRFKEDLSDSISLIQSFPKSWRLVSKNIRMCRMKIFPFGIMYQIRKDEILITSVFHFKREPKY